MPHTDLRPPRDCSLPAQLLSDDELQALVGFKVERKLQIVLTSDDRWFSRTTAGWVESQARGEQSAELDPGPSTDA